MTKAEPQMELFRRRFGFGGQVPLQPYPGRPFWRVAKDMANWVVTVCMPRFHVRSLK